MFLLYPESDNMSQAFKQYLKSPRRHRVHFCVILHNSFGVPEAAWPRERARGVAQIGYAALKTSRLRTNVPPTESEVRDMAQGYLEMLCREAAACGVRRASASLHMARAGRTAR